MHHQCRAFADVVKSDFSKPVNAIKKVRKALNYDVVEDKITIIRGKNMEKKLNKKRVKKFRGTL